MGLLPLFPGLRSGLSGGGQAVFLQAAFGFVGNGAWKNCERKLETSLQFIHLAFLALLLRRL